MKILPEIDALVPEMKEWRHHIHAHPETAFEETGTSAFVAEKLRAFGLEVHTGMAKTGVVGVLHGNGVGGNGNAIGLRADLDALHVHERSGVPYASRNEGKMHACGHDGYDHAPGAARRSPPEELRRHRLRLSARRGKRRRAGVMVEEGLFDVSMRAVYGMHNWPRKPLGVCLRVGR
jgi:hippurate hydrolase